MVFAASASSLTSSYKGPGRLQAENLRSEGEDDAFLATPGIVGRQGDVSGLVDMVSEASIRS